MTEIVLVVGLSILIGMTLQEIKSKLKEKKKRK